MVELLRNGFEHSISHVSRYQPLLDEDACLLALHLGRHHFPMQIEEAPLDIERAGVQGTLFPAEVLLAVALRVLAEVPTGGEYTGRADRPSKRFSAAAADQTELCLAKKNAFRAVRTALRS